jgi:hypothetical protein
MSCKSDPPGSASPQAHMFIALRFDGSPCFSSTDHTVLGLTTENVEESFLLEASQGDSISGKISRDEVASVMTAALQTPASTGELNQTILVQRYAGDVSHWFPAE